MPQNNDASISFDFWVPRQKKGTLFRNIQNTGR